MALNEIGGSTAATRGLTEDINDTIDYADYVENIKKEKKHKHKYDDDMDEY